MLALTILFAAILGAGIYLSIRRIREDGWRGESLSLDSPDPVFHSIDIGSVSDGFSATGHNSGSHSHCDSPSHGGFDTGCHTTSHH